jgi:cob(I)alamin adenosyltransferase
MSESKYYTGKGDQGDTARLGGAGRLPKSSALIDTIGALDEATAALGMARAHAQDALLRRALPTVQRHLCRLMAHLSATPEARADYPGLNDEDLAWLESLIARLEARVPPVKAFVLPGDSVAGAAFHLARTVVRRAERRLVGFCEEEAGVGPVNVAYVNRLSSLAFVAALREDDRTNPDAPEGARD